MFVDETAPYISLIDDKNARHLEAVAQFGAIAVAFHDDGLKAPYPGAQTVQLPVTALHQTESRVILAHGVADVFRAVQSEAMEKRFGGIVVGHVNKDDADAEALDVLSEVGNIGQGFPAKGTAKMPQKYEQHRAAVGGLAQGNAAIGDHVGHYLRVVQYKFHPLFLLFRPFQNKAGW